MSYTTPNTTKQKPTGSDGAHNAATPAHLQDHWAARPAQQRALLRCLFQWKAESGGKEVVLLAGAGLAEGCVAAETRLEYSLPSPHVPHPGSDADEGKQRKGGLNKAGDGGGRGGGQDEKDEEEDKPKKAKRRRIGIEQVCTCWARGWVRPPRKLSHLSGEQVNWHHSPQDGSFFVGPVSSRRRKKCIRFWETSLQVAPQTAFSDGVGVVLFAWPETDGFRRMISTAKISNHCP